MKSFEAEMRHDRKSLVALSHMQYDLFCTRNRTARGVLSAVVIVAALAYGGGSVWSLLLIAYGCYLLTSTYAASNRTAHKIADQLEAAGRPLPASRYVFEKDRMRIFDLNSGEELEALPYGAVLRLGEDLNAYYLFRTEYGGYRIPKSELGEREEEFRRFVQNKTGKLFIRRLTPLNRVRQWLHARDREPEHL
ncbi:MAG: YcxB family protein [Oscillospiraceae bacterium]|nr:YcxB family protein [Oscillospiraceae bacterium]